MRQRRSHTTSEAASERLRRITESIPAARATIRRRPLTNLARHDVFSIMDETAARPLRPEHIFLLLPLVLASETAWGQSRVDDTLPKAPEQRQTPDLVALDLTLGGVYATGNVKNRSLNGSLGFSLHPAADHRLFVDLSGSFNQFGGAIVLDRQRAALLYAYSLATHLNIFFYTTHARNRFLRLDYRTDNSVGLCGHSFLPELFSVLLLSLGATPEYEKWQAGDDEVSFRATVRVRAEVPITETATIGVDATFTPVMTDFTAYRAFGSAFAELKITPELLAFRVTATDEYDSRPQPGVVRNDFNVASSLIFRLAY